MSLIEAMMDKCCLIEKERTPDGAGGFVTSWHDGAEFLAAVTLDTTMEARIAEKDGVTSVYTVTTSKSTVLAFHDVFRRLKDGKIFRVTSDAGDKVSPEFSSLDITQVSAEKWSLTS